MSFWKHRGFLVLRENLLQKLISNIILPSVHEYEEKCSRRSLNYRCCKTCNISENMNLIKTVFASSDI